MNVIQQIVPWPPVLPPMFPDLAANERHWAAVANVAGLVAKLGPGYAVTQLFLNEAGEIDACSIVSCDRELHSRERGFVGWVDDPIATHERCVLRAIRWPDLFARGLS